MVEKQKQVDFIQYLKTTPSKNMLQDAYSVTEQFPLSKALIGSTAAAYFPVLTIFLSSASIYSEGSKNKKLSNDKKIAEADYKVIADYAVPLTLGFATKFVIVSVATLSPVGALSLATAATAVLIGVELNQEINLLSTLKGYTVQAEKFVLGDSFTSATDILGVAGMASSAAYFGASMYDSTPAVEKAITAANIPNQVTQAITNAEIENKVVVALANHLKEIDLVGKATEITDLAHLKDL